MVIITTLKIYLINKYLISLAYIALLSSHSLQAANDKLNVSVPSFAPFNAFVENSGCSGASVMAVQKTIENLNVELKFVNYPYARILYSLKTAELDLALIFKNTAIEDDADYIGPLSYSKIVVVSHIDNTIDNYDDLYTLKNIAVIRNAQFEETFDQDRKLNKANVDSYQQAVKMLKHGRVDAVIGSLIGIEYALHQQNMNNDIISKAFHLGSKEWGLHLSKKSKHIKLKPSLIKAVKKNYQEDLIHQLYEQQIQNCI
ncbi:substrate-binding periplasmic protein [Cognaticolwellia mytili]|uniref:substrate-binding periplasmic protein n=1 Tax=Cognaticolwellia mytili TaxID=1888913 RepID=UPI000A173E12|nr:transporter substrate-binding domain-containing protein [Cognaticolwellia mytili]